jgi:hypothetical protein
MKYRDKSVADQVTVLFRGGDPPEPPAALCWPGGRPPGTPRCAVLARGTTPSEPPLHCAGPGGDPPEPPAALRARAVVLRRDTGHSPGPRARFAGPVTSASP